jgi:hypothetical protein
MHKMSFEVKAQETHTGVSRSWPLILLVATVVFLSWTLEPALIHMWLR